MKLRHALAVSASIAALGASVAPASAQDAAASAGTAQASSDMGMPEILVTARRRSEDVSKIPLAVTTFSSDTLANKQVLSTTDLTKLTPGLNIITGGGNVNPLITIRGQSRTLAGASPPGVITYFNDVPLLTFGSLIPTFDMDNIQVLKGPQGTLFGRNAVGGAVLTYAKKPTYNWEGYGEGSYGAYKSLRLEGAINIPIIKDVLAVRIAGQTSDTNGYTKTIVNSGPVFSGNLFTGDLAARPGQEVEHTRAFDAYKTKAFRASVLFEPTSSVQNVTTVDYFRSEGMNNEVFAGTFFPGASPDAFIPGLPKSVIPLTPLANLLMPLVYCGTSPNCDIGLATAEAKKNGPRVQRTDMPPDQTTTVFGVSNATTFDIGPDTTIKNIFGYRTTANDGQVDIDGVALPLVNISNRVRMKQITEELQLSGKVGDLKYVLGGFYLRTSPNGIGGFQSTAGVIFAGLNAETNTLYYLEKSKALYGQVDYDLSNVLLQGLGVTAGFRYTWDEATGCAYSADYSVVNGGTPPGSGNYGFNPSYDQCKNKSFTPDPRASLFIFDASGNPVRAGTIADNFATKSSAPTWTVAVNWQATPDVLVYATTRRGYKAGGFNTPKISKYPDLQNFVPETLTDVEIGLKSRFRVGNMPGMFNIDIYQGKDKNYQYYQNVTGVQGLPPNGLTLNKADLTFRGVEAELTVKPVPGLTLGVNGSYTDFKVDKVTFPAGFNQALIDAGAGPALRAQFTEITVANQPKYILNANAEYIVPQVVGGADLRFNVDFHYQSEAASGQYTVPGWEAVDAQLSLVGLNEGRLTATAWVKNLTDKVYVAGSASSSAGTGVQSYSYAPPRTYGVTLRYKFN